MGNSVSASWLYKKKRSFSVPLDSLLPPVLEIAEAKEMSDESGRWPFDIRYLKDISILPFLLPIEPDDPLRLLKKFVQRYYYSACALMINVDGEEVVIGSASASRVHGWVVTSSKNYERLDAEERKLLFARFYLYSVVKDEQSNIKVEESYVDFKVARAVDFPFQPFIRLELFVPQSLEYGVALFTAKCLEYNESSTTPMGLCAFFHFIHDRLHLSMMHFNGAALEGELDSKVSGVALINFSERRGEVNSLLSVSERLPFWVLCERGFRWNDIPDTTPKAVPLKLVKLDPRCHPIKAWIGNEFKLLRAKKPSDPEYKVGALQSCHHIIPLTDLRYLWQFLHENEPIKRRAIQEEVLKSAEERFPEKKVGQDHSGELKRQRNEFYLEEFERKSQAVLQGRYGEFLKILYELCPPAPDGQKPKNEGRFVWSWWNLFKGWSNRADDPKNSTFYEYARPCSFSTELHTLLVGKPDGLYWQIQRLKKVTLYAEFQKCEADLYKTLQAIQRFWQTQKPQRIAPFDANDWEKVGYDENEPVYRLKQTVPKSREVARFFSQPRGGGGGGGNCGKGAPMPPR